MLWVDGDEVLQPEDVGVPRLVAGLFEPIGEPVLLRIVQENQIGTQIEPNYDMSRLHSTRKGIRWWGRIHEQLGTEKEGRFKGDLSRPVVRLRVTHDGYQPEIMQSKQKLQRNIRLLRLNIEERPDDVASWGFLGRELLLSGQVSEGIDALYTAESLAVKQPSYGRLTEVRAFLTDALLGQARIDEAIAVTERSVADSPHFPGGWYGYGKARLAKALRLLKEARAGFEKAQSTAPGYRGLVTVDRAIGQWRAAAGIADVAKLTGNWIEATTIFNQVLAANPGLDAVRSQVLEMQRQASMLSQQEGGPT